MPEKPHLSPSSINMMQRCEAQWYFRYVEQIKKPPGIALLYGKSMDTGINHNMKQKIESHDDLKEDEVVDAFVTEWDNEKSNTLILPDDKQEEQREGGINLIRHYHKERAPEIQPESVQEKMVIEFDDFDYDLLQYSDIITDKGVIIDNKTAGKSPPKTGISFDHKLQMTAYDLGYRITRGKEPKGVRLDYLIKTKTPKMVYVDVDITETERGFLQTLIGITAERADLLKSDSITPTPNRGHFLCSKRFCGFWKNCEKAFGGRVKE